MSEFYNPYHFIPLVETEVEKTQIEHFAHRDTGCSHDVFRDNRISGRIICTMETKTPIFIGAEQPEKEDPEDYNRPVPFTVPSNDGDVRAIPQTSLKGMLTSVAEAASASTMRILDNTAYSRRADAFGGEALSAVGQLTLQGAQWAVVPLAVPTLVEDEGKIKILANDAKRTLWKKAFSRFASLKVYSDQGWAPEFENDPNGNGKNYCTLTDCVSRTSLDELLKNLKGNQVRRPSNRKIRRFVIGQIAGQGDQTVRFIKRDFRRSGTPGKHDLYIPIPADNAPSNVPIPVSDEAIETFKILARERSLAANRHGTDVDQRLPYKPRPMEKDDWTEIPEQESPLSSAYYELNMREGDLVFFDIVQNRESELEVSEFAYSQIWRKTAGKSNQFMTTHDFVADIDPELLHYNPARTMLTPAERLFGFVSEPEPLAGLPVNEPATKLDKFKGRVRFSLGLPDKPVTLMKPPTEDAKDPNDERRTKLKLLDTPKPPSPALYFTPKTGDAHVTKEDLSLHKHLIQGRKSYLNHNVDQNAHPWVTKENARQKQKSTIVPIDVGNSFWFHLDFDDLTEEELNLLCFSLTPSPDHWDKIGMGRPIGLGSVSIQTQAIMKIDRPARYTAADFKSGRRYQSCELFSDPQSWPDQYKREADEAAGVATSRNTRVAAFCESDLGEACKDAIDAIVTIGAFRPDRPVTYPVTAQQFVSGTEDKLFEWFALRGKKKHQGQLKPIDKGQLPTLTAAIELRPRQPKSNWNRKPKSR